ncbi:unnamed protein product [Wuchereria bancrofti]|uniref:Uncharacterized protein n=1 Tax=Wuchereria bancrofti TaxID=6293 RepID=A0A3P7FX75_WUCBA|nr:unnamed protein product [Wuchereria bancrofti]
MASCAISCFRKSEIHEMVTPTDDLILRVTSDANVVSLTQNMTEAFVQQGEDDTCGLLLMNNSVEVADDKSHNKRHPSTNTKANIFWPGTHFWRGVYFRSSEFTKTEKKYNSAVLFEIENRLHLSEKISSQQLNKRNRLNKLLLLTNVSWLKATLNDNDWLSPNVGPIETLYWSTEFINHTTRYI